MNLRVDKANMAAVQHVACAINAGFANGLTSDFGTVCIIRQSGSAEALSRLVISCQPFNLISVTSFPFLQTFFVGW